PVSVTPRPSCVQLRHIAPLSALPRQGKEPRTNVRCIAGSRAPPPPHWARTARDRTQGVLPGSAHPGFGPAGSARDPTQGVLRGSAHPGFGPAGSARDPTQGVLRGSAHPGFGPALGDGSPNKPTRGPKGLLGWGAEALCEAG